MRNASRGGDYMIIPKTRSAKVGPMDAGFLAPLITDFEAALTGLGHTSLTIKGYTDSARHFAAWACEAGLHLDDISKVTSTGSPAIDCQCAGTRRWHGVSRKYARRAGRFVGFLAERGVVSPALRARGRARPSADRGLPTMARRSSRPVGAVGLAAGAHDPALIACPRRGSAGL